MQKVLWSHMLNRTFSWSYVASFVWLSYGFGMSFLTDGKYAQILMIVCTAAIIVFGCMLPKPPEALFLMPVSRTERERHIKRLFLSKLVIAALLEAAVMAVAVLFDSIQPFNALLIVIDAVVMSYAISMAEHYEHDNGNAYSLMLMGAIVIVVVMLITAEMNFTYSNIEGIVISVFSLMLWCVMLARPVKAVNGLCAKLADYEKLVITNMPMDERNKLKEKGAI